MKSQYVLPITIVVAGAMIASAVFLVGKSNTAAGPVDQTKTTKHAYNPGVDHIIGNPAAPVKIVEYADLECPHCKLFNTTMHQVVDHYAPGGKVAWVFRNFPLTQIHSKAPKEAEAAECAGKLGGDAAFFKFIDQVFAVTPSENGLDLGQLPKIATQIGLNVNDFNACYNANTFTKKVTDSYSEAIAAGGTGTPYILIMVGDDAVALSGDQPYASMLAAVNAVIAQLPASTDSSTNLGQTASTTTQ